MCFPWKSTIFRCFFHTIFSMRNGKHSGKQLEELDSSLLDIILPVLIKYFSHGSTHNGKDFMVHAKCFEWKLICCSQFHLYRKYNLVLCAEVNQQTVCTLCTCILVNCLQRNSEFLNESEIQLYKS